MASGVRGGADAFKAIALGADAAALALPFLKAAERSEDAVVEEIERVVAELRTAMFVTGSATVADLRCRRLLTVPDPAAAP